MADTSPRAFFSYARDDAAFVLQVAQTLRQQGRKVWVDQLDIPKGARWDEAVESALRASRCLMVVLSPASVKSQNVMDEVAFALDEKRPVLPILLKPVAIPFRLKRLQYIDFTGDFGAAFEQLVAALDMLPAAADDAAVAPTPAEPARDTRAAAEPPVARPPAAEKPASPALATRRFPLGWAAGVAFAAVVVVAYVLATRDDPPRRDTSQPTEASTQQPAPALPRTETDAPRAKPPPARADAEPVLDDARIRGFVSDYILAQNRASAAELLSFYAARVDYFDAKGVGHDFILGDKQAYYKRWPVVDNRVVGEIAIDRSANDGSATVSYLIQYKVSSPARADAKSGVARDVLVLRLFEGRPLIVAQRQQVAPSGAAN